jgi:hypothetical protein
MIEAHCLNPRCPILDTCKAKFAPPPDNARPGVCYARPMPFSGPWIPPRPAGKEPGENRFAVMARQERELRHAAIEGCGGGLY